jgi:hypothetical protein
MLVCLAPVLFGRRARSNAGSNPTHVSVPVWIDPQPKSLNAEDVVATLNGQSAAISQVLGPSSDLVVLVVLDVTGDISLIDLAKRALISQIDGLPENAWVGLLRAQDGLSVIADPTPDRKAITDAIQALPATGKAGLIDTLVSVAGIADGIERKSHVRVAVLYVTDSSIYNYREDFTNPVINSSDPHDLSRRFPEALIQEKVSNLETQISSDEAPVFVVHLRYRTDRMNQAYQNGLKTLAEFTAGYSLFCRSDAEIPDAIQKAFAYIRSSWFLSLRLPKRVPAAVQVRLKLPQQKDAHVAYRAHLRLKPR